MIEYSVYSKIQFYVNGMMKFLETSYLVYWQFFLQLMSELMKTLFEISQRNFQAKSYL